MEEERKWEELGVDCLANIFSKLDLEDLTTSAPFVCKPWLEASRDHQCWRALNLRDDVDLMPWGGFSQRLGRAFGVKRLSFAHFMSALLDRGGGRTVELAFPAEHLASLQDLVYASVKCPRLKVLSLPNLFHREDKQLPGLMEKWKDLEFLTMGRKPSSFPRILEQIGLNCKNFAGLRVSGCINDEDTSAIVRHLPDLKYLAMAGSSLSKRGLLAVLDGCRRLEVVDTSNCTGFDVDEEILERASRVKAFKCAGAKLFEDYMDCYDDVYWGMVF